MPSTDIHSIFISGHRIYVQCFETVLGVTVNRIHLTKISKQQKINVFVRVSFLSINFRQTMKHRTFKQQEHVDSSSRMIIQ